MNIQKDEYANFAELKTHEQEGKDFLVALKQRKSNVLVMAIHGGKIEYWTSEIAESIAVTDYSLYKFEGIKPSHNKKYLHITSTKFDEPRALNMVNKARIVITVHGKEEKDNWVMVGGLSTELVSKTKHYLEEAGFKVKSPAENMNARNPMNICNRGLLNGGVQLEIGYNLREELMKDSKRLKDLSNAVRKAINTYILEDMEMHIDKTDGAETYFSKFVDGFMIELRREGTDDFYSIVGYDLRKLDSGDTRPALVEIKHLHEGSAVDRDHRVCLCVDLKSHDGKSPFHINVDWESKDIKCNECETFVQDYPAGFDHMPLLFKEGEGGSISYKLVDHNLTVEGILYHLKKLGLFKKYPNHWISRVSPTDDKWLDKIKQIISEE